MDVTTRSYETWNKGFNSSTAKSKASSTSSRYLKEIDNFCSWCQSFKVAIAPPFSASLVLAYLSKVYLRSSSYSSVVLAHAALKWFHTLASGINP